MPFTTFPKAHIGLRTTQLEAAIAFYTDLFGVPPVKIRRGYAKFLLNAPPLNLALSETSEAVRHSGHFGIQVATTDDVLTRKAALEARYPVRVEMNVSCCYARQDKFWVRDPDGNEWEVFVFHEDVEDDDSQAAAVPSGAQADEQRFIDLARSTAWFADEHPIVSG